MHSTNKSDNFPSACQKNPMSDINRPRRPNNMMAFEMPDNMTICHWRAPEKARVIKKIIKHFIKQNQTY
jgi:hypothetical protein